MINNAMSVSNFPNKLNNKTSDTGFILLLLVLHIGLGFIGRSYSLFSTFHAVLTIGLGFYFALFSKKNKFIVWVTSYIIGAELFWRMTQASIFYEAGKYAIFAILFIAFLRTRRKSSILLPILYFVMLLISIPLTLFAHDLSERARQLISFNLSGPLALCMSVMYFSQIKLNLKDFQAAAWYAVFPIFSILTISAYSTFSAENLKFSTESNFITSGGYGPNQISAILGLGAVFMLVIVLTSKSKFQILMAASMTLLFLAQSALTFSRGGLLNFTACVLTIAFHYVTMTKQRNGGWIFLMGIAMLGIYLLYPKLDQFTGGLLTQRYQELDFSGRDEKAILELGVWKENPLLGVGPGEAAYQTELLYGNYAVSHTEYTRLLSEHGIPGIAALILLLIICFNAYKKAPNWNLRMWTAVLIIWSLVEMSHAAMRIAAISYLIGMANANWLSDSIIENNKMKRQ